MRLIHSTPLAFAAAVLLLSSSALADTPGGELPVPSPQQPPGQPVANGSPSPSPQQPFGASGENGNTSGDTTQGTLGGAASTNSSGGGGTGGVLLGLRKYSGNRLVSLQFNLSGPESLTGPVNLSSAAKTGELDGQRNVFGRQLLDPTTQARSVAIRLGSASYVRHTKQADGTVTAGGPAFGYYTNAGVTLTNWKTTITSDGPVTSDRSVSGPIGYFGIGLQLLSHPDSITIDKTNKDYALGIQAGISGRFIMGDLGRDEALRNQLLGSKRNSYIGPEVTVFATMGDVEPFVRVTHFPGSISGFSGTQVIIGVNALTALFSTNSTNSGGDSGGGLGTHNTNHGTAPMQPSL